MKIEDLQKENVESDDDSPKTWIGKKIAKFKEVRLKYQKIRKKEIAIRLKRKEKIKQRRKHMLRRYLSKAGLQVREQIISKKIFNVCILFNLFISGYLIYYFSIKTQTNVVYLLFLMAILWVLIFFGIVFLVWLLFYLMIDFKIFNRKTNIEEVLADFLQLTSANIRAGMAIDKALWFSVRPRFGVLAKEIEIVAKETISGKPLESALLDFTKKYDSTLLKRSISLLIEGLRAGGEVGNLLNKISGNISESRLMKKEMSANVTTYVIFITFATVVAAPVLFALSNQLLQIINSLISTISRPAGGGGAGGFSGAFSTLSVQPGDFIFFAISMLVITSFFSASIIAIIKKGSVKGGIKYIPSFIVISISLFYLANYILSLTLGGIII